MPSCRSFFSTKSWHKNIICRTSYKFPMFFYSFPLKMLIQKRFKIVVKNERDKNGIVWNWWLKKKIQFVVNLNYLFNMKIKVPIFIVTTLFRYFMFLLRWDSSIWHKWIPFHFASDDHKCYTIKVFFALIGDESSNRLWVRQKKNFSSSCCVFWYCFCILRIFFCYHKRAFVWK